MKKQIVFFSLVSFVFGQMTGLTLAIKIENRKKPNDIKSDMTMILTNKKGKSRTSKIRSISQNGGEKQMIWFLEPADDKGVAFLKIEHSDKDDEMRMWLPAFKKIRGISSKKKNKSFMGSDMNYEDMSSREIDDYTYEIIGNEEITGRVCWILKSIPKDGVTKTYSYHKTWIDQTNLTALKEESYDKLGVLLKQKKFRYNTIDGYIMPIEFFVENVQKKHSTKLVFENIELNSNIPDNLFHQKNLKRIPKI